MAFRLLLCLCGIALVGAANAPARKTWNGCKCKKTWKAEIAGQADCQDSCCNPDKDPYGQWCMVADASCEESEWGYCQPVIAAEIHDVSDCSDYEGWMDKDGDSCKEYSSGAWCTMAPGSAVPGVGWHEEWGTIRSFGTGARNISGFTACCACGGGHRDSTASVGLLSRGAVRHTWNSCKCKPVWQDPDLGKCQDSCCNLDHDPYGEWCQVDETNCEDADWGYCRPAGINTVHHDSSGCKDVQNWKDKDGDGCKDYAENSWCTSSGGYDLGWHDEWGTFASLKSDGKVVTKACCACGGGVRSGNVPAPPPPSYGSIFTRKTWNGCACKINWSEYAGTCATSCCNPDSDPYGDWCMVDDTKCEDSDWGYCQPTLLGRPAAAATVHPGCEDKPSYKDTDGDGCAEYASNAWCTSSGEAGVGWHEEWGEFVAFKSNGETAVTACCACGGGKRDGSAPTFTPTAPRDTWNGCRCSMTWSQGGGADCAHSCCNPDRDPLGDWCLVEDPNCEDSDWGYCKTAGADSILPWEFEQGGCTDSLGWKDRDGDDCHSYRTNNWCRSDGGYNVGWHEEWGTFADFAGGPRHETANQACCACGRGTAGAQSTLGVTTSSINARFTRNKCSCLKVWEEEGVQPRCEDFCCNPDADPDGDWCFVEDSKCEGSDWGYCQSVGPGAGKDGAAPVCLDKANWKDSEGDDCATYDEQLWCDKTGDTGVGWHEEWGDFKTFGGLEGLSAADACCACGGGTIPIREVEGKIARYLFVSIGVAALLALVMGGTTCHYRNNYNKILYAAPGQEHVRSNTMGKQSVVETPEEI